MEKKVDINNSFLKREGSIKVNGVEIEVSEYLKDPEKYNSLPMDPNYVKNCEKHLQESIANKAKLAFDPNTVKSIF